MELLEIFDLDIIEFEGGGCVMGCIALVVVIVLLAICAGIGMGAWIYVGGEKAPEEMEVVEPPGEIRALVDLSRAGDLLDR